MNITPKLSDFFHRKWQVRSNKKLPSRTLYVNRVNNTFFTAPLCCIRIHCMIKIANMEHRQIEHKKYMPDSDHRKYLDDDLSARQNSTTTWWWITLAYPITNTAKAKAMPGNTSIRREKQKTFRDQTRNREQTYHKNYYCIRGEKTHKK